MVRLGCTLWGPMPFSGGRPCRVHQFEVYMRASSTGISQQKSSKNGFKSTQPQGATFVGRQKGIADGKWASADQGLVKQALLDADNKSKVSENSHLSKVLLGKSVEQLGELAELLGDKKYRGKQIYDALYHGATSVNDLKLIPQQLRDKLADGGFRTGRCLHHDSVIARDRTHKLLRQLHDGRIIETVGIPADEAAKPRLTACVSSQVGCPMRCTFCATGKGGYARNLYAHEIVDQVLAIQETFKQRVTNVVFMGMGEPMLNVPNVVEAVRIITSQVGIGARNITISTVGVKGQLRALAQYKLQCYLAVSLHAPNQELRERLVPSAKAYPLDQLLQDCFDYFKVTSRRVTFEYTLLRGVNDAPEQALELIRLLKKHHMATHVNLIPWNPIDEVNFKRPKDTIVESFKNILQKNGVTVSVRVTRGLEAAAACGQLRNLHQKTALESYKRLE